MNVDRISDWREACAILRAQPIVDMDPQQRAEYAYCAATYRDAMRQPWPAAQAEEATRLADEFAWLFDAAVALQELETES